MDFSVFYAKLIGLYFVILAIAMLVNSRNVKPAIMEMIQNRTLIILTGLFSVLFGLIIVLTHNIWTGWPVIITVLGYITIIRGVVRVIFTDWFLGAAPRLARIPQAYHVMSVVLLVLGVILLYFGYMHL
jgi:hypothetical protein